MKLVVFDLDNTLFNGNCSFQFFKYLHSKKVFRFISAFFPLLYFLKYQLGFLSVYHLHKKVFQTFLVGKNLSSIEKFIHEFLDQTLENSLNPKVLDHLKTSQRLGQYTLLLSSSPEFIVKPIAKKLKIQMIQATEYKTDHKNRFCEIATLIHGLEKMRVVQRICRLLKVSSSDVIGYSDSYDDLPFLKSCGKVYLVNPDRKLKSEGMKFGWKIL